MQDKHRIAHGTGLLVGAGLGWCSVPAQAAAAAQPQSQSWIWILIGVVAVMLVFMIAYLVRGIQADREQPPENEAPAYIPYEPRAAVSSAPDEQPDVPDTSLERGDDSASSALPHADEQGTGRPHEPEHTDVPAAPVPEDEPAPANAATEPADCPTEAQRPAPTQAPPQAEPATPDAWSIRFCPYCGQNLNETQRFCQRCGHRVRE